MIQVLYLILNVECKFLPSGCLPVWFSGFATKFRLVLGFRAVVTNDMCITNQFQRQGKLMVLLQGADWRSG